MRGKARARFTFFLHTLFFSRYLSSESGPSKADMADYEIALKSAGCEMAPLTC